MKKYLGLLAGLLLLAGCATEAHVSTGVVVYDPFPVYYGPPPIVWVEPYPIIVGPIYGHPRHYCPPPRVYHPPKVVVPHPVPPPRPMPPRPAPRQPHQR